MSEMRNKQFVVEALRRLLKQVEDDEWGEASFEVTADHVEKPRFSWQPYRGVDLVGQDVLLRLRHPKKGSNA